MRRRMKKVQSLIPRLLAVIVVATSAAIALDPHKTINQYGHDVWLRHTGLPANAIYTSLQTRDGYLWFGTAAGLFRFDGDRFDAVSTLPNDNKNRESVSALCEASDGSLWIGTSFSQLCRIKDGTIRRFGESDGIMSRNAYYLVESRTHALWLGTSYGLYKLEEGRFTSIPINPSYITGIAEDATGRLWVGTQAGIRIFSGNRQVDSMKVIVDGKAALVTTVYADRRGCIWIGTYQGLVRWNAGTTTTYKDGLLDPHISAVCEDRDGNIWAGTNKGGLYRLTGGKWSAFTTAEGLSSDHVQSILEDREGSLWVATRDGLNRFKDVNVTTFTTQEGLSSDDISSVIETPDGSMFFLSPETSVITEMKGGIVTQYPAPVGPSYVAHDGSLWIGQTGALTNFKGGRLTRYDTRSGLPNQWVSAIGEDDKGLILYINQSGMLRFVDGKLTPYLLPNGQRYSTDEYVSCFYPDTAGVMWIGTSRGLVRIQNGQVKAFGLADGMADHWVNNILDDQRGSLWIGSPHGGLTRYRNGKLTAYTTKDGLFTNEIFCVLVDDMGDLWLSSPRGVGRISRSDLDDFEAGHISAIHTQVFMTADGMKTDECFGGWQPGAWKAHDGRLWFATRKGAVMIDPKALVRNELPPSVLIKQVLTDQYAVPLTASITLPPGKEQLEFQYTALSFLVPERVLFKYMLEGYDRGWVDAGTRRVAFYTNLWPGEYRFRVKACNNDGVWNESGASVELYLTPHFYQRYWFYGLCLFLIGVAAFGVYRWRVRSFKDNKRQLENLVHIRTDELRNQRTFLRKVIDLDPNFIFAKDIGGHFTLANQALSRAYGASPDKLIGKMDADFNGRKDEVEKFLKDDREILESGIMKFIPEEQFTDAEGKRHWMQVTKIPIQAEDGIAPQILGVATDITEHKTAEERIKVSLHEKEVLLKEIHHRVKNNLQVVSSLLNLQASQMQDEAAKTALMECKSRVRSMALIHESLYRSDNLAKINFGEYLRPVTNELVRSFGKDGVSAVFEVEPIFISIDTAIPCGLIVNELVTNALKHAFRPGEGGVITITLRRRDTTRLELSVRDNGIGFPCNGDFQSYQSMGMNLILSLTEQIGGTIVLDRDPGTTFRIEFPADPD